MYVLSQSHDSGSMVRMTHSSVFLQKVRRSCKKLAQKLNYVDTPWEMPYDLDLSSSLRSSTMSTREGSSDTTAGGTSYVRTPSNAGKGPVEHDVEEDEDKDEDAEEDYDEIGMSQLGDAPFPT